MPRFHQAIKFMLQSETPIVEEPPSKTVDLILAPIQQFLQDFANDKSQSELLFLLSILLAISLFAVILPLCESLFGSCSFDDDDGIMMEISKIEELSNNSNSSGGMRMYKAGVGVVEMSVEEIAELTLIRSSSGGSSSRGGSSDCDSSRSSVGSFGSCSLETIEESEEEYDSEDEE